jgi:ubiquinone/menaquinone biosynthesis C-methylase UbiE
MTGGTARDAAPDISFEARAYQDFVRGLRAVWRTDAYAATVAEAERTQARSAAALERAMADSQAYQLYGWLERRSQQFKYLGRWGMVPELERQAARLERALAAGAAQAPERLRLDPDFVVPDYVRASDTHQHPGATWGRDIDAFVYEWATEVGSFALGDADRPLDWYAALMVERFAPRAILDLGCSLGKCARALKRAAPDATVDACDVAAPLLKLAHLRTEALGVDIMFWQRAAEALGFADASFDLVSSHWLVHEMPPAAIRRALREMRRVLRPGGAVALYDMHLTPGGPIAAWLHRGYAARNNEPFAAAYAELYLAAELTEAGFDNITIELSELQRATLPDPAALPPARTHLMTVATARAA